MVRYLGWLANAVLFTLCCFLVADTANAVIAALLGQSSARAIEPKPHGGPENRNGDDRQWITQRNLFHSTTVAAPASTAAQRADENLKETQLPLKLWGTIAAADPALSWASIEETGKGVISAVKVGDRIQNATIVGIGRRRVVLLENGSRRALSLDEEDAASNLGPGFERSRPATRATTARASRRTSAKTPLRRTSAREAPRTLSSLYSQARIVPKIDSQTNVVTGLEVSAIQSGSVFEQAGVANGEIITEINGVPVSEMGPSNKIMAALTESDEVDIVTMDPNGVTRDLTIASPR
jgi:type II secretion system protein C